MLPVVVRQLLLQLRYPTQFVEEPLVYGRQLVDAIDTHATVQGLNGTDLNVAVIFITTKFISAQIRDVLGSSRSYIQMLVKRWRH